MVAPRGRLTSVLTFAIEGDRVAGYELVACPGRLAQLDLALLDR